MLNEVEGIMLRNVKTLNGRSMLTLFTRQLGKISAGTGIRPAGRNKSNPALNVFSHGSYEIAEVNGNYYVNSAAVIKTFYDLGQDIEKFAAASYAIEFVDKAVMENEQNGKLFFLLLDYLKLLEKRNKSYMTLLVAFMIKSFVILGIAPSLEFQGRYVQSDSEIFGEARSNEIRKVVISIAEGGSIYNFDVERKKSDDKNLLIPIDFDIISIINFCMKNDLRAFKNIKINEAHFDEIWKLVVSYAQYHLDMGQMKSESFLN